MVRFDATSQEGTFFGRSTGWNSDNSLGGIHLGVTNDDKLFFVYRPGYTSSLQFTSTATLDAGTDYGFYVDFNGGNTGSSSDYSSTF